MTIALIGAATTQAAAPADAVTSDQHEAVGGANRPCRTALPKEGEQEITICVEKPEGYRIDPDLMEAERAKKANRKLKPPERMVDRSCATVGPMGCRGGGGINLVAAALTAAEMARRAANGENVGEMFVTEPQPDEYQLYLDAKREREEKEAIAKAEAQAKAGDAPQPPGEDKRSE